MVFGSGLTLVANTPGTVITFSPHRLKDWYAVLGLTVRHGYHLGFVPPWLGDSSDWLRTKFEHAGQRWWPLLGGVYVLDAIKRIPAMRRLRPAWHRDIKNISQPVALPEQSGNLG